MEISPGTPVLHVEGPLVSVVPDGLVPVPNWGPNKGSVKSGVAVPVCSVGIGCGGDPVIGDKASLEIVSSGDLICKLWNASTTSI